MGQLIRTLDPQADFAAVEALYAEAAAFWLMTDREPPDRAKVDEFFTDCPPGGDPALSHRLGFFQQDRLIGVAELGFGFPNPEDAYLGLMLFAPSARVRLWPGVSGRGGAIGPRAGLPAAAVGGAGRECQRLGVLAVTGICGDRIDRV